MTTVKTIASRAAYPVLGDILVLSLLMWAGIIYAVTQII